MVYNVDQLATESHYEPTKIVILCNTKLGPLKRFSFVFERTEFE